MFDAELDIENPMDRMYDMNLDNEDSGLEIG